MGLYDTIDKKYIQDLVNQGCVADDWSCVEVSKGFSPRYIHNVRFSGKVRLGRFDAEYELSGGLKVHSGVRNATLHNVAIGDDCYISNVQCYIANYNIGSGCIIENVESLFVDGKCGFGNGVEVSVLTESGGREVVINCDLSAHLAYIMALYRHRPQLIASLKKIISDYVSRREADYGTIGRGVRIVNAGRIQNISIGDAAVIEGAAKLCNGTVNSNAEAPVYLGRGVICSDFIISSGSTVTDGAQLDRCFVGQSCHLGHNYTASNSLFFSNCQGENGEACAIFAGPFTVTHHKSTLLIAGMFSFMNAGSGSNQSNHMYKLGPIHQGTLERGAKTTSNSYILWPARVGAFSLVMGRHVSNADTTNLPFSYLIERDNSTYLVPAINLRSVGTIRDVRKWPQRDARKDSCKLDCINYNLLSPFTVRKMLKAVDILSNLQHTCGVLSEIYSYKGTKITNQSLRRGLELYDMAIHKFMGNSIINRLGMAKITSDEQLRLSLQPSSDVGCGEWVDLSGLIAPKSEVERIIQAIENGELKSVSQINEQFAMLHTNYYDYEWSWVWEHIEQFYGISPENITRCDVEKIVLRWKEAVIGLDKMLYEDARKEFSMAAKTGFGADGSSVEQELDFEQVRGDFESNEFVQDILRHIATKSALGDDMLARLRETM